MLARHSQIGATACRLTVRSQTIKSFRACNKRTGLINNGANCVTPQLATHYIYQPFLSRTTRFLTESALAPIAQDNFRNLNINSSKCQRRYASSSSSRLLQGKKPTVGSCTILPDRFKMEWPKITLFGDSITRRSSDPDHGCWGSLIAYKTGSYFDVDARGFEGYNSKWALDLMPMLFPKSYLEKVEVFVIFFGHNDSLRGSPMHLTVSEYRSYMQKIIKYLLDNGLRKEKIILMTPSWYHVESFLEYLKEIRMPPFTKELEGARAYSETLKQIGSELQIEALDFFSVSESHHPLKELFCDGIHFSRKGARLLFDHLMPIIERKLEHSFKKPLADLWHAVPFEQRPELKALAEAHSAKRPSGEGDPQ